MKWQSVETFRFKLNDLETISFEITMNASELSRHLYVNGKCCNNPDATWHNAGILHVRQGKLAESVSQTYEIGGISVLHIGNLQDSCVKQKNFTKLGN